MEEQKQVNEPSQGNESKGMSIAAMVLGIIAAVLFCFVYISIPCAILAIIFGFIGRGKGGKGMATAGIVLGIVAIALYVLSLLGLMSFFTALTSSVNSLNEIV